MGLNGNMPKALDISFTDKHGEHHKVHVKIPSITPHGSEFPTVYLVFEGATRLLPTRNPEADPMWRLQMENAPRDQDEITKELSFTIQNRTEETLSKVVVHTNPSGGVPAPSCGRAGFLP